ncbi:MAG: hypothetical protein ABH867_04875 [Patescibacteria group bacterium]|nr:hypothetical protein [Patescibacteria group bacterium]
MLDLANRVNNSVYFRSSLAVISVLFLFFEVFRYLRADHKEEKIVAASFFGLAIVGFLVWFSEKFQISIALSVLIGTTLSVSYFCRDNSWQFWSVLESVTGFVFISLAIFYLGRLELIGAVLVLLSNFYWRNYRNFNWYPSGRSGFMFFADIIVFSLFNSALDFWRGMLIKSIVWILIFIIGIIGLILFSRRTRKVKTVLLTVKDNQK